MDITEEMRPRLRATWAAGNWDKFSDLILPVGAAVVDRLGPEPGTRLLDVGTGSGRNVAIRAAERGATVTGLDITPELLEDARANAEQAGVDVEWVEGDAADLPFEDRSFDRVASTFGAMFAPEHARAAAELVRVCRPGGLIAMTTWVNDGFAGELFTLTGRFLPPPPEGVEPPPLWGVPEHVEQCFAAAGATPELERGSVDFVFPSLDDAVEAYMSEFGPFVMARGVLEPQGRYDEFRAAFRDLVARFNVADDGGAAVRSEYFLITVSP
jgi:SAM-dependent methyltransferase